MRLSENFLPGDILTSAHKINQANELAMDLLLNIHEFDFNESIESAEEFIRAAKVLQTMKERKQTDDELKEIVLKIDPKDFRKLLDRGAWND